MGELTFVHMVEALMGRCETTDIEITAVVVRKIWLCRNGLVYGAEGYSSIKGNS